MLHFYILVITQIVTESLPISSSGHEILVSCMMRMLDQNTLVSPLVSSDIVSYFFNIPTLIIVPIFFFATWWPLVIKWRRSWRMLIRIAWYVWVACAITASLFLAIRSLNLHLPLWIGFSATAGLLFSLWFIPPAQNKQLSVWHMVALGLAQGCAAFPGLSRLAVVYVSARWFGFNAHRAFGIAWLIQWPLVLGASGISMLMLFLNPSMAYFISPTLLCIMAGASIVSYICLCLVYRLAITHHLYWISLYMIIPLLLSYWCAL